MSRTVFESVINILSAHNIAYTVIEHEAARTEKEAQAACGNPLRFQRLVQGC